MPGGCLHLGLAASVRAMGSQGVAAVLGVPTNGVAVGSQSGELPSLGSPVTGPLTSGFGGAPRGIRTPNRQIRSLEAAGNLRMSQVPLNFGGGPDDCQAACTSSWSSHEPVTVLATSASSAARRAGRCR
jgi:hypothetical protein